MEITRINEVQNNHTMIMKAADAFRLKIDMFMKTHVVPYFNPENIIWWLSVSGGKDSFSMMSGVKDWYETNGLRFTGYALHINQWTINTADFIKGQVKTMPFVNIDGRDFTQTRINYVNGDQAPCRKCSDARRELSDNLLLNYPRQNKSVNFLARGLHLTDTVISILWRRAMGYDLTDTFFNKGKGRPIVDLWPGTFLVKPLYYVREFESQSYAQAQRIQTCCCGCPACLFPSRRDIIEETIAFLFHDSIWEFSVPEIRTLFSELDGLQPLSKVLDKSAPGKESKVPRLPKDFCSFVVNYYRKRVSISKTSKFFHYFEPGLDLDEIGLSRLRDDKPLYKTGKIPLPSLLQENRHITHDEELMITALGPFWGAIGLEGANRENALELQKRLYGLEIDETWGHLHRILTEYYKEGNNDTLCRKRSDFLAISNFRHSECYY